jgi:glutamine cyclotransferase
MAGRVLVLDADTLTPALGIDLVYEGEGWGLCTTESEADQPFVMSDGTAILTIRDPDTFAARRTIEVIDGDGYPVPSLNELECVGGQVLANVWRSDRIVVIDLSTGAVAAELDLSALVPEIAEPDRAVLNGIAYRRNTGTYLVTGKLWPAMFEIAIETVP